VVLACIDCHFKGISSYIGVEVSKGIQAVYSITNQFDINDEHFFVPYTLI